MDIPTRSAEITAAKTDCPSTKVVIPDAAPALPDSHIVIPDPLFGEYVNLSPVFNWCFGR